MKNFIQLTEYTRDEIQEIFKIADKLQQGKYADFLKGKSIILTSCAS